MGQGGGISTLVIFIAIILVAAIAAYVYLRTGGTLESQSLTTGKDVTHKVSSALVVESIIGENEDDSEDIEQLKILVKLGAGSSPIDMTRLVMTYDTGDELVSGIIYNQPETSGELALLYDSSLENLDYTGSDASVQLGDAGGGSINDPLEFSFDMNYMIPERGGYLARIELLGLYGGTDELRHTVSICELSSVNIVNYNCPSGWTPIIDYWDGTVFPGPPTPQWRNFTVDHQFYLNPDTYYALLFDPQFLSTSDNLLLYEKVVNGGPPPTRTRYSGPSDVQENDILYIRMWGYPNVLGEKEYDIEPIRGTGNSDRLLERGESYIIIYRPPTPLSKRKSFTLTISPENAIEVTVKGKAPSVIRRIAYLYPIKSAA